MAVLLVLVGFMVAAAREDILVTVVPVVPDATLAVLLGLAVAAVAVAVVLGVAVLAYTVRGVTEPVECGHLQPDVSQPVPGAAVQAETQAAFISLPHPVAGPRHKTMAGLMVVAAIGWDRDLAALSV